MKRNVYLTYLLIILILVYSFWSAYNIEYIIESSMCLILVSLGIYLFLWEEKNEIKSKGVRKTEVEG